MPTWTLIAVDNLLVWVPPARRQWQTIDWKAQTETFSKVVDISGQPQCVNNGVRAISTGDIRRLPLTVFIGLGSSPIKHSKGLSLVRHIFLSINSTHTPHTCYCSAWSVGVTFPHIFSASFSPFAVLPQHCQFHCFLTLVGKSLIETKSFNCVFPLAEPLPSSPTSRIAIPLFSGLQQDSTETLFA